MQWPTPALASMNSADLLHRLIEVPTSTMHVRQAGYWRVHRPSVLRAFGLHGLWLDWDREYEEIV